jgi:hypothetical protein
MLPNHGAEMAMQIVPALHILQELSVKTRGPELD